MTGTISGAATDFFRSTFHYGRDIISDSSGRSGINVRNNNARPIGRALGGESERPRD
jgi:hypothetical protein